jgi:integrase
VLRNALNAAARQGIVARNVAALASPPRITEAEFRALSLNDARAILRAVAFDRLEAVFTVGLALGLRRGEALGLRWGDVDLDGGALRVDRTLQRVAGQWRFLEPKTVRSRRTVPIPGPVVDSLRRHRARQNEERLRMGAAWQGDRWGTLVFTDEIGGPLSGFHVRRRLVALLRDAGLSTMRYHDLRHGAASLMAAQGVPARAAMEILGHSQISTTMNIYSHIAPDVTREATEKVAAALWGVS